MKFPLKGDRNYIHGTDIFSWLEDAVRQEKSGILKSLSFKRFAVRELFLDFDPQHAQSPVCTGNYVTATGEEVAFAVIEGHADGALGRKPYDEDGMLAGAVLSGNRISMQAPQGFTNIEILVAMTKRLCYALQVPEAGKWVFGHIHLAAPLPKRMGEVAIENRSILNKRFAVNRVTVDGEEVAEIRFIVGAP